MSCECLIIGLFKESQLVFEGREESLANFWVVLWFISQDEQEQRFLS